MRRLIWVFAAVAALTGSGLAVAHGIDSKSVKAVSATFTATTASVARTSTCTGSDGTYVKTNATYSGTSTSSDPSLNGPVSIYTESLINTTTNLGIVSGKLRFGDHNGAQFDAVYSNGNLAGLRDGTHERSRRPAAREPLGRLQRRGWIHERQARWRNDRRRRRVDLPRWLQARAAAEAREDRRPRRRHGLRPATPASITVAGVTCTIPPELQGSVVRARARDRHAGRDDLHRRGRREHAVAALDQGPPRREGGPEGRQEAPLTGSAATRPRTKRAPRSGRPFHSRKGSCLTA